MRPGSALRALSALAVAACILGAAGRAAPHEIGGGSGAAAAVAEAGASSTPPPLPALPSPAASQQQRHAGRQAYASLLYGDEFMTGLRVLGQSLRDTGTER